MVRAGSVLGRRDTRAIVLWQLVRARAWRARATKRRADSGPSRGY